MLLQFMVVGFGVGRERWGGGSGGCEGVGCGLWGMWGGDEVGDEGWGVEGGGENVRGWELR